MNFRTALLGCSTGQLARIADAWGVRVEAGTLRRELVEAVAERLLAGAGDASTWDALGPTSRDVLRLLVQAGGRHEADLLSRRVGLIAGGADDREAVRGRVDEAIGALLERGLLIRVFDAEEQRRGIYLLLPDELLDAADRFLGHGTGSAGARPALTPVADPKRQASIDPASDLFALASALRRESWGRASRGLAGRRGLTVSHLLGRLRALSAEGPGDPGRRWRFLLWLAQRAGWIGRDGWPLPDDSALECLLTTPSALPGLALAAGPVASDAGVGSAGPSGARSGPDGPRRRQADALQLLSELDDRAWWSAEQLASWLADQLVGPGNGTPIERREHGRVEAQLGRWLSGRWFWLGLVRWGWDGQGWTLVAITPALRAVATGRSPSSSVTPRPCRLEHDLGLTAPPGAELAALYPAERYLAFGGSEDGLRRYGLTPASFDRGVRLGGDGETLLGLIERLTQAPVPVDWRAAVERWSSGLSRLRLAARLLLSSEREATLREALAVESADNAVVEELSPRHVVVGGDRLAALLADLARAGLPVEIDPGLRVEPADVGRSAALAGGVAETAWVALEVLRRLAPALVAEQRDLQAARGQLEAVLAAGQLEALGRRAAALVAALAHRRRPRGSRRVV